MVQEAYGAAMPTQAVAQPRAAIRSVARTAWLRLSSVVYLPALLIPAVALLLVGLGRATQWGGADFTGSLTSLRAETIGPLASA
ncbi:MAG: hypothetical protein JWQ32_3377, partial [Marmoricola sp.]|nr:hypothetical protein [Marmoricola sp.]